MSRGCLRTGARLSWASWRLSQSEIEASFPSFKVSQLLVLVLFAHILCHPTVPSTTPACTQLWYKPALTPAPYPIPNSREDAVVDPGRSGSKPAIMVGTRLLSL